MNKRSVARLAALLLTVFIFASPTVFASVSRGDEHWEKRAAGHRGSLAQAGPIDAAIAAYRNALDADPSDLEARWKLMRAIRFKGAYVATTNEEKKAIFEEGREVGKAGIARLESMLRQRGVKRPDRDSEAEIAKIAREIEGAGELYLWDAINWGEWAQVYGKLAAVRKGAADRILREATIAWEIDRSMEGAGPGRVLGRLHNQTPRVPFLTGWASDAEGVEFLQESLKLSPNDKLTAVFLAEAMVAADRSSKPKAVALLEKVIASPDDPAWAVEHASAREDAEELLREWK